MEEETKVLEKNCSQMKHILIKIIGRRCARFFVLHGSYFISHYTHITASLIVSFRKSLLCKDEYCLEYSVQALEHHVTLIELVHRCLVIPPSLLCFGCIGPDVACHQLKLVQLNFMHLLYAFCAHDMRRNVCVHAVRGNVIAMLLVLRIV
ncbi:hypothetical protein T4A_13977 [Trichinella pseudospiralis]|uniref:Uncharacterized protein n=1 Tax=Trichinella pseudospiralis TaxID=6337 RepID=A0A0V1E5R6_TRIPS|nr:hypothetical protein T4A_13977 [Trichinella pseudospiralis]